MNILLKSLLKIKCQNYLVNIRMLTFELHFVVQMPVLSQCTFIEK